MSSRSGSDMGKRRPGGRSFLMKRIHYSLFMYYCCYCYHFDTQLSRYYKLSFYFITLRVVHLIYGPHGGAIVRHSALAVPGVDVRFSSEAESDRTRATSCAYLDRRTGCCIAASWEGGASTCSDVPAWPSQCGGVRSSPAGTGSRGGRRWWCTASKGQHASGARRLAWSSSSGSRAYQSGDTLMREGVRGGESQSTNTLLQYWRRFFRYL